MFIGIEVGGTTVRAAAFKSPDSTHGLSAKNFRVGKDLDADLSALTQTCASMMNRHGPAVGVGLAVAGKVNACRSALTAAPHLPHWQYHPVAAYLADRLNCPVVLGNDAEAAALAEARHGNYSRRDFWFISWGTGIGGCLVRYLPGPVVSVMPGEPGHQPFHGNGLVCPCGQTDCWETYAGGKALCRRFQVATAADLTEPQWQKACADMASGLRGVVTTQPVPTIVMGGGVACKQRQRLGMLQQLLAAQLKVAGCPRIRLSAFGEQAGTIGALSLIGRYWPET
jgi:glucokinase